jgi:hypothetical protein
MGGQVANSNGQVTRTKQISKTKAQIKRSASVRSIGSRFGLDLGRLFIGNCLETGSWAPEFCPPISGMSRSGVKEVRAPSRYKNIQKGGFMINNMVLSREIEWIGYEHKRNMLQVEFIVGSIYQYENVPETVYQEFLIAPSYGRFFESNIKNKYQSRKIR